MFYLCRIFRLKGSTEWSGRLIFQGPEQNFTTGQSPKILRNFQNIIKINEKLKIYSKDFRKMQILRENFSLFAGDEEKIIIIIYGGYSGGSGGSPKARQCFKKFIEIMRVKLQNLITFWNMWSVVPLIWIKFKNNWKFYLTMGFGGSNRF